MSVDLATTKSFLNITSDHNDELIRTLMASAWSDFVEYAGGEIDAYDEQVQTAQLLYVHFLYYLPSNTPMDPLTDWPVSVAGLMRRYRTPTIK